MDDSFVVHASTPLGYQRRKQMAKHLDYFKLIELPILLKKGGYDTFIIANFLLKENMAIWSHPCGSSPTNTSKHGCEILLLELIWLYHTVMCILLE